MVSCPASPRAAGVMHSIGTFVVRYKIFWRIAAPGRSPWPATSSVPPPSRCHECLRLQIKVLGNERHDSERREVGIFNAEGLVSYVSFVARTARLYEQEPGEACASSRFGKRSLSDAWPNRRL